MMILADKIIELRKKNGWSQEELAEQMNVTRQSVSKWEGAQSIPDLEKILRLSQLFGVSTDYLLKDELSDAEYVETADSRPILRRVTMAEANDFLAIKEQTAGHIALASFLCIISPICLLILSILSEEPNSILSDMTASFVGLIVLLLLIAVAVAMFMKAGAKTSAYEYLEKEPFETEYGVEGMVRERQKAYQPIYAKYNLYGTCMAILSLIPLFIGVFFNQSNLFMIAMLSLMMVLIGISVILFIEASVRHASTQKLLQEGDYTTQHKQHSQRKGAVSVIYWLLATTVYLGYSFISNDWKNSWIVWPIAGVLFGAVMAACSLPGGSKQNSK